MARERARRDGAAPAAYAREAMAPGPLEELPAWAQDLIERAPVGRLGLLDDRDRPRVLPVTFAVCGATFVSAVDHKPKSVEGRELARVRWLRRNPAAALTVDRYSDDWSQLAWVQALCRAEVLDAAPPGALGALGGKYEQYRERPPAGPFLVLTPERLLSWNGDS
jgi:PPOX class probable F420-dependent enzyme